MRGWIAVLAVGLATAAHMASAAVCGSSAGCEFWDEDYHEYILNEWDVSQLDVLIIPPASIDALNDIEMIEDSVDAWEAAIDAMAASWLTDSFEIHRYTIGFDVPTVEALSDPEIIIVSGDYNPFVLLGIGLASPVPACLDGPMNRVPGHPNDGTHVAQVFQTHCDDLGNICLVVNTNFLFGSERRMYNLNAHELGHCLGIGHVGDALDFDAKRVPVDIDLDAGPGTKIRSDIMSYDHNEAHVNCVSTLNIDSIEGVFAQVEGQPNSARLVGGSYNTMATSLYDQHDCSNP